MESEFIVPRPELIVPDESSIDPLAESEPIVDGEVEGLVVPDCCASAATDRDNIAATIKNFIFTPLLRLLKLPCG